MPTWLIVVLAVAGLVVFLAVFDDDDVGEALGKLLGVAFVIATIAAAGWGMYTLVTGDVEAESSETSPDQMDCFPYSPGVC